jgi:hypothetical protein
MSTRSDWDRAYYGSELASQQIVIGMQGSNPGADPLREILTRYGSSSAPALPPAQTEVVPPPPSAAPPGAVQQQSLPPPRG